jgi:hypothetical protein
MSTKDGNTKKGKSERNRISRIITNLLEKAFVPNGVVLEYEDVESMFHKEVTCPIVFSLNK